MIPPERKLKLPKPEVKVKEKTLKVEVTCNEEVARSKTGEDGKGFDCELKKDSECVHDLKLLFLDTSGNEGDDICLAFAFGLVGILGDIAPIPGNSDVEYAVGSRTTPFWMDLHPVAVSSEWTMDRLDDDCIGLYEQYFEFAGLRWKGRFFFIDRRAIPDAMCWRHHDSDISDPAPKDGFDEDDVIALTNQPIDIRGIPSGLLFSAGLAITWEFPKFRPLFKDPEGNVFTSSFSFRDDYRGWGALTEQDVIPQHTTTPLSDDEQVPGKTDSQQRVEASDPKIVATRIRKAQAAAKRKAEKNRGSEGASGPEGSSKRRKEKSTDHIPCPTPLRTIEAVTSDVSRGENVVSPTQAQGDNLLEIPAHDSANTTTRLDEEHHDEHSGVLGHRDGNFDDDVDEEIDLEGTDRHVSDTTERVVIGTEPIPLLQPVRLMGSVGADEAGSSLPPSLFVPTWGIHQRSRVTTPEECQPGFQEEMHLLDNNVVLDRAGFDPYSDKKMNAEYERLFSKTYSYVDRISHLSEKPVQDLLKLHPAPPPRDAPKAGSGGVVFAPKLVRAAEVAHSKDTTSKEFSRSKTGPPLHDPASKHASGGSKAPPSKKT
ncbi:hypothetical protein Tco_0594934 [Tanacetum coccineum]